MLQAKEQAAAAREARKKQTEEEGQPDDMERAEAFLKMSTAKLVKVGQGCRDGLGFIRVGCDSKRTACWGGRRC